MSQCTWLQIFLNYILSFLSDDIDKVSFRKYLLGLIYNDKSFCVHKIAKNTKEKSMWQLYDFLESNIYWKNLFYQLAKLIISIFKALNFYLTVDGTPLKQEYATKRIAKHGHIDIKGMKNIPQGVQFTSKEFTDILKTHDIAISMDGKGRALDNIMIERFWRSLKYEEVYLNSYDTVKEAVFSIGEYIWDYNNHRPHSSFGNQTPKEVYQNDFVLI